MFYSGAGAYSTIPSRWASRAAKERAMKDSSFTAAKTNRRLAFCWGIAFIVAVTCFSCPSKVSASALDNRESAVSAAELETFGTAGK